jgi:hypothetical protein
MKPITITHRRWARLQTGIISSLNHGAASLRYEADHFVMRGPRGEHRLLAAATDHERLQAHWAVFATSNFTKGA